MIKMQAFKPYAILAVYLSSILITSVTATVCRKDYRVDLQQNGSPYKLQTPNYPNRYGPNLDCNWLFRAPKGMIIKYEVDESLYGIGKDETTCTGDKLVLYNGATQRQGDFRLGEYCGSLPPPSGHSSLRTISVKFTSDSFNGTSNIGFELKLQAIKKIPSFQEICPQGAKVVLDLDRNEKITTPYYPHKYGKGQHCSWLVETKNKNEVIEYQFHDNHMIEVSVNCASDALILYDGTDNTGVEIGRYCGVSTPPSGKTRSRHLFIEFKSDGDSEHQGFQIWVQAVVKGSSPNMTIIIIGVVVAVLFAVFLIGGVVFCVFYCCGEGGTVKLVIGIVNIIGAIASAATNILLFLKYSGELGI